MTELPIAQTVLKRGEWDQSDARCELTYEDRFFRRRRLVTTDGWAFIADFEHTLSLDANDGLKLADGRIVEVVAAKEDLLAITGDLIRLAWHIGNRHTPCQIERERLLIQNDPVIGHMLEHLGATVAQVREPFTPEGGAYGHGRTHSHDHGHTAHAH